MMTEDIQPDVLKRTQDSLGRFIKKPVLSDKLLRKPPFRFLHDICTAAMKETGFLEDILSGNDIKIDLIKDKEGKIAFLQKVIAAVETANDVKLAVKPTKIVAGHEPIKTNEFLQALAIALEKKVGLKQQDKKPVKKSTVTDKTETEAVKRKNVANKPSSKTSEQPPPKKDDKKRKSTDKKLEKTEGDMKSKIKKEVNGVKVKANPKKTRVEVEKEKELAVNGEVNAEISEINGEAHNDGEGKQRPVSAKYKRRSASSLAGGPSDPTLTTPQIQESGQASDAVDRVLGGVISDLDPNPPTPSVATSPHDALPAHAPTDSAATSDSPVTNEKNPTKGADLEQFGVENALGSAQKRPELSESNESPVPASARKRTEVPSQAVTPVLASAKRADSDNPDNKKSQRNEVTYGYNSPLATSVELPPQTLVSNGPVAVETNNHSESGGKELQTSQRPRTAIRPPSARPASARPAAPRVRDRGQVQVHEEVLKPVGKVNLIAEQDVQQDEDELVLVQMHQEGEVVEETGVPAVLVDGAEHGHLVNQILEAQKELEDDGYSKKGLSNRTEIEWSTGRGIEATRRDMDKIRSAVQALTRSANPLGKLLEYLQDDVDSMQQELQEWRDRNSALSAKMETEKSLTDKTVEPLKSHLLELEESIRTEMEQIGALKASILRNDEKINRTLVSL